MLLCIRQAGYLRVNFISRLILGIKLHGFVALFGFLFFFSQGWFCSVTLQLLKKVAGKKQDVQVIFFLIKVKFMLRNMKEIIKKDCKCVLLYLVKYHEFTIVDLIFLCICHDPYRGSFHY